ncbi:hypothetical protein OCK74_23105 [Chitinophagaceae bacterium LB-8]|uniref:PepSY domain-containing protein n=1 Tax=Paraflavisolibacter caeni TaxID=2982496 RepID=A0A9X2XPR9_9BACT|nr:hypothetical protein [Paraflavisolibacter caeni]MCU7552028.1 hypothetical protein [Paraflavisolibacter caeni]
MKTMILSLLLTGCSLALWAQDKNLPKDSTARDTTTTVNPMNATDTSHATGITGTDTTAVQSNQGVQQNQDMNAQTQGTDTVSSMRSSGAYNAYGNVPPTIRNTFTSQFPNAGNATWEKDAATNMWHARYASSGRIVNVFMDERGNSYTMALPIIQSLVSENTISSAINKYGPTIYDVLQLKTGDSSYVYQVRLIENGQVRAVYMNEDGSDATYTYAVHTDSTGNMNNANWNNANAMDSTSNKSNMNNPSATDTMSTNQNTNMNNNSGNQTDSLNATDSSKGVQDMDKSNDSTNQSTNKDANQNTDQETNKSTDQGTKPDTDQSTDQKSKPAY